MPIASPDRSGRRRKSPRLHDMLRRDVDRYEPPPDRLRHVQLVLADVALGDLDIDTADLSEVIVAATALREVLEVLDLLRST